MSRPDQAPPPETFVVSADGKSITCKRCHMTSHHPLDVVNHYCGFCHVFHDDVWPPIRKKWLESGAEIHLPLQKVRGAIDALRSYQYGNASPELAREIADDLESQVSRTWRPAREREHVRDEPWAG